MEMVVEKVKITNLERFAIAFTNVATPHVILSEAKNLKIMRCFTEFTLSMANVFSMITETLRGVYP